jgi:UDP-glucose-4-epimerase GalE
VPGDETAPAILRLLVTGGAGYIGGFATRLLLREGHDVVVVDNLSSGHGSAIDNAKLVEADVADGAAMRNLLRDFAPDAVLHFSALKSVAESWREPDRYHAVNVVGTRTLLEAMRDTGVSALVYSGSCSIYGRPDVLPVDESQPAAPLSPYARSKWLAELEVANAHDDWGLRYCTLRYFNAGGAEPDGFTGERLAVSTNLIPVVMRTALGLAPSVPVYGTDYETADGTAIRDYVHVADLARAHERAVDYLISGGNAAVVNVGTGVGHSVLEVISTAEQVTNHPIPFVDVGRRDGDAPAIWASVDLAEQLLGWRAVHGIDDILASAWRWHSRELSGDG